MNTPYMALHICSISTYCSVDYELDYHRDIHISIPLCHSDSIRIGRRERYPISWNTKRKRMITKSGP